MSCPFCLSSHCHCYLWAVATSYGLGIKNDSFYKQTPTNQTVWKPKHIFTFIIVVTNIFLFAVLFSLYLDNPQERWNISTKKCNSLGKLLAFYLLFFRCCSHTNPVQLLLVFKIKRKRICACVRIVYSEWYGDEEQRLRNSKRHKQDSGYAFLLWRSFVHPLLTIATQERRKKKEQQQLLPAYHTHKNIILKYTNDAINI